MSDAIEEHNRKVSIGGRSITKLRFADDSCCRRAGTRALVESLDKICTRYNVEISGNGIQRQIKVKGQKLCTVTSFKYIGDVFEDDCSKP